MVGIWIKGKEDAVLRCQPILGGQLNQLNHELNPKTSAPPATAAKAATKQLYLNKKLGKPKR